MVGTIYCESCGRTYPTEILRGEIRVKQCFKCKFRK